MELLQCQVMWENPPIRHEWKTSGVLNNQSVIWSGSQDRGRVFQAWEGCLGLFVCGHGGAKVSVFAWTFGPCGWSVCLWLLNNMQPLNLQCEIEPTTRSQVPIIRGRRKGRGGEGRGRRIVQWYVCGQLLLFFRVQLDLEVPPWESTFSVHCNVPRVLQELNRHLRAAVTRQLDSRKRHS